MSLQAPHYINEAKIQNNNIRYKWDDWDSDDVQSSFDDDLLERISGLSYRAVEALNCGSGEWVVYRLHHLSNDPAAPISGGGMGDDHRPPLLQSHLGGVLGRGGMDGARPGPAQYRDQPGGGRLRAGGGRSVLSPKSRPGSTGWRSIS